MPLTTYEQGYRDALRAASARAERMFALSSDKRTNEFVSDEDKIASDTGEAIAQAILALPVPEAAAC